jgi:erythromycin esterase-like protein
MTQSINRVSRSGSADVTAIVRKYARLLQGVPADYDVLLDLVGDAKFVLLGEATHGTHEFYKARADITKRLVTEKGFNAVAVEADWPDAYKINRFVRRGDGTAVGSLSGFKRFPTWMWRNADVLAFIEWLRKSNESLEPPDQCGFYGMDLYSLYSSMDAVINYLEKVDPDAAERARQRYACFEHFGDDEQAYGYATNLGLTKPCEDEVVQALIDLKRRADQYMEKDGHVAEEEYFFIEQNARVVKNAEEYYRMMFDAPRSTWNLRDRHMTETLHLLSDFISRDGKVAKLVVWAHNSHLGDARFTEMARRGELNVGQLVKEHHAAEAISIGFTTYTGTVTAASTWGGNAQRKFVRPALGNSYEGVFHATNLKDFILPMRGKDQLVSVLRQPRLERAIGVLYIPQTERMSHYFEANIADQFDAIIHFDDTMAVEPLERDQQWTEGEVPETYPSGL